LKASLRLPPTLNSADAEKILRAKLLDEKNDTFGAQIELLNIDPANGFDAPKLPEDLYQKFINANKVSQLVLSSLLMLIYFYRKFSMEMSPCLEDVVAAFPLWKSLMASSLKLTTC
jgi:hypothetical protein